MRPLGSRALACCWPLLLTACGAASPQQRPPRTVAPAEAPPLYEPADVLDETQPPLGRLPQDVSVERYVLDLEIRPDQERFGGTARLELKLSRPRKVLWIHGQGLRVREVTVRQGEVTIPARWEAVDEEAGLAAVRLERVAGPGALSVRLTYAADFSKGLDGLYRVEVEGRRYAFTQMEPIDARKVFPCLDEPAFRAPFEVTLRGRKEDTFLANAPAVEDRIEKGSVKVVRFAPTRPLPTYLVAFAVGPFDVVEAPPVPPNAVRQRPLPLRGVTVAGRGERIRAALSRTGAIVAALEDYFGVPYPFAKLDLVAVPDFGAGAMENAGLVTFREWFLLWDERATERQRRAFLAITAHELAHQWFGNLVTLPWWDELWLNESFATWMSSKVVERLAPEHRPWVSRWRWLGQAMSADSLASARRIRNPIESRHDISSAFDSITYAKGAAVLRMVETWLGEDAFQQGIRAYLKEHAWGHGSGEDLFHALSKASGKEVAPVMASFTDQEGLPLLTLTPRCEARGQGEARLTLQYAQRRYLPLGSELRAERTWRLPLTVRLGTAGASETRAALLAEPQGEVHWTLPACPDWLSPNAEGAGYFRFALPEDWTSRLLQKGWASLPAAEQMALADSLLGALRAGALPLKAVLAALPAMAASAVPSIASRPHGLLRTLAWELDEAALRRRAVKLGAKLYLPVLRRLGDHGRQGEPGDARLLRADTWRLLAVDLREPRTERKAARLGERLLGLGRGGDGALHLDAVEPELRGTALSAALRRGGAPVFDRLVELLGETQDPSLRGNLLDALGSVRDEGLAARARELSLDPRLRRNEVMSVLWSQMRHPATREAAWAWFREHFEQLAERVTFEAMGWSPWLASGLCRADAAEQVRAFFQPYLEKMPGAPRHLAGTLEALRLCDAFRTKLRKEAPDALR